MIKLKKDEGLTLQAIQGLVLEMVKKCDLETSPELRYIDLTSEMGELGKELLKGSNYGKQDFNKTNNLESEMGDTLFSLTCIANSLDIDLSKTLIGVIQKYNNRFAEKGSIGSEKLKKEEQGI